MTQPIQDRLISYLDAFESAVVEIAPQAAEAALMWARIDAASGLVVPLLSFVALTIAAIRFARPLWAWGVKYGFDNGDAEIGAGFLTLVWGAAMTLSLTFLLNIWRWVGIFHPEMWLIHKAISTVTG